MPLKIAIARQLTRIDAQDEPGRGQYQAEGGDPGLVIKLPFVRKRFVVILLEARDQMLDPQVYLDRGAGYNERDSVVMEAGYRHVIIVDVGVVGMIRAVRLDPATTSVLFTIELHDPDTLEEAEALAQRFADGEPDTRFHRLTKLRGFAVVGHLLSPPFRSPTVASHAKSLYAAAALENGPLPDPTSTERWLSLVVPVYDAPKRHLEDIVRTFRGQNITGVELILSDDGSQSYQTTGWLDTWARRESDETNPIRIVRNLANGGIAAATNAGIAAASGRWVGLLDHDDLIAPHALKRIYAALQAHPDAQFLYTDELVVDDRLKPTGYMLKPAYDPVLLTGVNYINHFSIYRRDRLEAIGRLRNGFEGSQDYDLLLRYLHNMPQTAVVHLPYPAYWWRRTGNTYSRRHLDKATTNARRALSEALAGQGRSVDVRGAITDTLHRVSFGAARPKPKVSIVIPSKNAASHIGRLLPDLFERTDYPDFEVLVIDNGSTDPVVLDLYERYVTAHRNFSVHIRPEPFNFSRSVNRGCALATGNHVLLLNNDVSVTDPDWLSELVECLEFDKAGIVGAKLLYPDDTLQHAGVMAGFGGLAGHWYLGKPRNFGGPMNRLHVRSSVTCVTGAVMLISGECLRAVGRFDEANFAVAYNDVDYCLRAYRLGFRTIFTPFACLYHHESASRGAEKGAAKRERFAAEKANLRRLHGTQDFIDPASSPLQTRNISTPKLTRISRLPPARLWRNPRA